MILLQMQRAFSRGVVDLLRQRLTSAVGYQRSVVEGLALLFLTRDDPAKAIECRKVMTDEDGRRFHAKYQRAIACIIEAAELTDTYNSASGLTMHLRFTGAIGLDFEVLSKGVDGGPSPHPPAAPDEHRTMSEPVATPDRGGTGSHGEGGAGS